MKKIFIAMAMCLFALSVNAQSGFFGGMSAGFNSFDNKGEVMADFGLATETFMVSVRATRLGERLWNADLMLGVALLQVDAIKVYGGVTGGRHNFSDASYKYDSHPDRNKWQFGALIGASYNAGWFAPFAEAGVNYIVKDKDQSFGLRAGLRFFF